MKTVLFSKYFCQGTVITGNDLRHELNDILEKRQHVVLFLNRFNLSLCYLYLR